MTFAQISASWPIDGTEEQKRQYWEHLAEDGWLQACRKAISDGDCSTLDHWLRRVGNREADVMRVALWYGQNVPPAACAWVNCALAVLQGRHWPSGTVPLQTIDTLAKTHKLPRGLVRDMMEVLAGRQRPEQRAVTVTALLIGPGGTGVAAQLKLELMSGGQRKLYPAPELNLVGRDQEFCQAQARALDYVRAIQLWRDDYDVRWRLTRLDGKFMPRLAGPSLGGAFGLGLCRLLAEQ